MKIEVVQHYKQDHRMLGDHCQMDWIPKMQDDAYQEVKYG